MRTDAQRGNLSRVFPLGIFAGRPSWEQKRRTWRAWSGTHVDSLKCCGQFTMLIACAMQSSRKKKSINCAQVDALRGLLESFGGGLDSINAWVKGDIGEALPLIMICRWKCSDGGAHPWWCISLGCSKGDGGTVPVSETAASWGAVHRNQFSMPKGVCSATKERNSNISLSVSPSSYSCCLVWVFSKHVLMCGADACLCSMSRLFVRIRNKYISGFTRRRPPSSCEASLSREQRHVAVDVFSGRRVAKG